MQREGEGLPNTRRASIELHNPRGQQVHIFSRWRQLIHFAPSVWGRKPLIMRRLAPGVRLLFCLLLMSSPTRAPDGLLGDGWQHPLNLLKVFSYWIRPWIYYDFFCFLLLHNRINLL